MLALSRADQERARKDAKAEYNRDVLLRIEGEEGQVQDNRKPVAIDHEEEGQESVDGSFGDDVGVETVAQVDRIDVVTARGDEISQVSVISGMRRHLQLIDWKVSCIARDQFNLHCQDGGTRNSPLEIAVHNGEKHLKEEVDGIDQYRQQIQPRFTRHDGQIRNALAWKVSKKVERFEK